MGKQVVSVIITDLDNTLFDWFEVWYQCFAPMLDALAKTSGINKDVLIPEIKAIHEAHRTSEYAFLIEELPSLQKQHPGQDLTKIYDDAIHQFRKARLKYLKLYPGVMDTLRALKDEGTLIVAYTESMGFYTNDRIRRLELDGVIDIVYSPEDHDLPPGMSAEQIRKYPAEHYMLKYSKSRHTPKGEIKPNREILLDIIKDVGVHPIQVIYIGDSLVKDVRMAQLAGVTSVYARYGKSHTKEEYNLLRDVTHWTSEDVATEKKLTETDVVPSFTIDGGFSQILALFRFTRYRGILAPPSDDRVQNLVDIWKTTIGVQQHFNDLCLRIRNFAITVSGAILGAAGFAVREHLALVVSGVTVPLSAFLLFVGALAIAAFWLMDRHWYHRLLVGAVLHGEKVENALVSVLPEAGLTKFISAASPIKLGNWQIHARTKMDLLYGLVGFGLLILAIVFFVSVEPVTLSRGRGDTEKTTFQSQGISKGEVPGASKGTATESSGSTASPTDNADSQKAAPEKKVPAVRSEAPESKK